MQLCGVALSIEAGGVVLQLATQTLHRDGQGVSVHRNPPHPVKIEPEAVQFHPGEFRFPAQPGVYPRPEDRRRKGFRDVVVRPGKPMPAFLKIPFGKDPHAPGKVLALLPGMW